MIAQSTKRLFSKHSIFRSGLMDLPLEYVLGAEQKKFGSDDQPSKNPHKVADQSDDADDSTPLLQQQVPRPTPSRGVQLAELRKKEKLYKQKFIDKVDWLDQITFAKLEEIKQEVSFNNR